MIDFGEWQDGMKFYPGQSGVYQVRSEKAGERDDYSYFCSKKQKWNGGWKTVEEADQERDFFGRFRHQGFVDRLIENRDFQFRGLVSKP